MHAAVTNESVPTPIILPSPDDDRALAFAAGAGDAEAFSALYLKHRKRTAGVISRIVERADVEDVNQVTWVKVFCRIGEFRGDAAFASWLHRLARNEALMHLRKASVRHESVVDDESLFPVVIAHGTDSTGRLADAIALEKAAASLPPGYRKAFYYHDVLGYEHHEIAAFLGCSEGTSRSQLHCARKALARMLR